MDTLTLVVIAGSFLGQVAHIVKKRMQEEKGEASEWQVFRKWILARPLNTIASSLGGIAAAMALAVPGTDLMVAGVQAALAGWVADSSVNRAGPPAEGQPEKAAA